MEKLQLILDILINDKNIDKEVEKYLNKIKLALGKIDFSKINLPEKLKKELEKLNPKESNIKDLERTFLKIKPFINSLIADYISDLIKEYPVLSNKIKTAKENFVIKSDFFEKIFENINNLTEEELKKTFKVLEVFSSKKDINIFKKIEPELFQKVKNIFKFFIPVLRSFKPTFSDKEAKEFLNKEIKNEIDFKDLTTSFSKKILNILSAYKSFLSKELIEPKETELPKNIEEFKDIIEISKELEIISDKTAKNLKEVFNFVLTYYKKLNPKEGIKDLLKVELNKEEILKQGIYFQKPTSLREGSFKETASIEEDKEINILVENYLEKLKKIFKKLDKNKKDILKKFYEGRLKTLKEEDKFDEEYREILKSTEKGFNLENLIKVLKTFSIENLAYILEKVLGEKEINIKTLEDVVKDLIGDVKGKIKTGLTKEEAITEVLKELKTPLAEGLLKEITSKKFSDLGKKVFQSLIESITKTDKKNINNLIKNLEDYYQENIILVKEINQNLQEQSLKESNIVGKSILTETDSKKIQDVVNKYLEDFYKELFKDISKLSLPSNLEEIFKITSTIPAEATTKLLETEKEIDTTTGGLIKKLLRSLKGFRLNLRKILLFTPEEQELFERIITEWGELQKTSPKDINRLTLSKFNSLVIKLKSSNPKEILKSFVESLFASDEIISKFNKEINNLKRETFDKSLKELNKEFKVKAKEKVKVISPIGLENIKKEIQNIENIPGLKEIFQQFKKEPFKIKGLEASFKALKDFLERIYLAINKGILKPKDINTLVKNIENEIDKLQQTPKVKEIFKNFFRILFTTTYKELGETTDVRLNKTKSEIQELAKKEGKDLELKSRESQVRSLLSYYHNLKELIEIPQLKLKTKPQTKTPKEKITKEISEDFNDFIKALETEVKEIKPETSKEILPSEKTIETKPIEISKDIDKRIEEISKKIENVNKNFQQKIQELLKGYDNTLKNINQNLDKNISKLKEIDKTKPKETKTKDRTNLIKIDKNLEEALKNLNETYKNYLERYLKNQKEIEESFKNTKQRLEFITEKTSRDLGILLKKLKGEAFLENKIEDLKENTKEFIEQRQEVFNDLSYNISKDNEKFKNALQNFYSQKNKLKFEGIKFSLDLPKINLSQIQENLKSLQENKKKITEDIKNSLLDLKNTLSLFKTKLKPSKKTEEKTAEEEIKRIIEEARKDTEKIEDIISQIEKEDIEEIKRIISQSSKNEEKIKDVFENLKKYYQKYEEIINKEIIPEKTEEIKENIITSFQEVKKDLEENINNFKQKAKKNKDKLIKEKEKLEEKSEEVVENITENLEEQSNVLLKVADNIKPPKRFSIPTVESLIPFNLIEKVLSGFKLPIPTKRLLEYYKIFGNSLILNLNREILELRNKIATLQILKKDTKYYEDLKQTYENAKQDILDALKKATDIEDLKNRLTEIFRRYSIDSIITESLDETIGKILTLLGDEIPTLFKENIIPFHLEKQPELKEIQKEYQDIVSNLGLRGLKKSINELKEQGKSAVYSVEFFIRKLKLPFEETEALIQRYNKEIENTINLAEAKLKAKDFFNLLRDTFFVNIPKSLKEYQDLITKKLLENITSGFTKIRAIQETRFKNIPQLLSQRIPTLKYEEITEKISEIFKPIENPQDLDKKLKDLQQIVNDFESYIKDLESLNNEINTLTNKLTAEEREFLKGLNIPQTIKQYKDLVDILKEYEGELGNLRNINKENQEIIEANNIAYERTIEGISHIITDTIKFSRQFDLFTMKFFFFGQAIDTVFRNFKQLINNSIQAIVRFIEESNNLLLIQKRLTALYNSLNNSLTLGKSLFKELTTLSVKTIFTIEDLSEAFTQFKAIGIDSYNIFKLTADTATAFGIEISKISDDIARAIEGDTTAYKNLRHSIGLTNLEIKRLGGVLDSSGRLFNRTSEAVLRNAEAVKKFLEKYKGTAEQALGTLGQVIKNLTDAFILLKISALESLDPLKEILNITTQFFFQISENETALGVLKSLTLAFTALLAVLKSLTVIAEPLFHSLMLLTNFSNVINSTLIGLVLILENFESIDKFFKGIGINLERYSELFKTLISKVNLFVGQNRILPTIFNILRLNEVINTLNKSIENLGNNLANNKRIPEFFDNLFIVLGRKDIGITQKNLDIFQKGLFLTSFKSERLFAGLNLIYLSFTGIFKTILNLLKFIFNIISRLTPLILAIVTFLPIIIGFLKVIFEIGTLVFNIISKIIIFLLGLINLIPEAIKRIGRFLASFINIRINFEEINKGVNNLGKNRSLLDRIFLFPIQLQEYLRSDLINNFFNTLKNNIKETIKLEEDLIDVSISFNDTLLENKTILKDIISKLDEFSTGSRSKLFNLQVKLFVMDSINDINEGLELLNQSFDVLKSKFLKINLKDLLEKQLGNFQNEFLKNSDNYVSGFIDIMNSTLLDVADDFKEKSFNSLDELSKIITDFKQKAIQRFEEKLKERADITPELKDKLTNAFKDILNNFEKNLSNNQYIKQIIENYGDLIKNIIKETINEINRELAKERRFSYERALNRALGLNTLLEINTLLNKVEKERINNLERMKSLIEERVELEKELIKTENINEKEIQEKRNKLEQEFNNLLQKRINLMNSKKNLEDLNKPLEERNKEIFDKLKEQKFYVGDYERQRKIDKLLVEYNENQEKIKQNKEKIFEIDKQLNDLQVKINSKFLEFSNLTTNNLDIQDKIYDKKIKEQYLNEYIRRQVERLIQLEELRFQKQFEYQNLYFSFIQRNYKELLNLPINLDVLEDKTTKNLALRQERVERFNKALENVVYEIREGYLKYKDLSDLLKLYSYTLRQAGIDFSKFIDKAKAKDLGIKIEDYIENGILNLKKLNQDLQRLGFNLNDILTQEGKILNEELLTNFLKKINDNYTNFTDVLLRYFQQQTSIYRNTSLTFNRFENEIRKIRFETKLTEPEKREAINKFIKALPESLQKNFENILETTTSFDEALDNFYTFLTNFNDFINSTKILTTSEKEKLKQEFKNILPNLNDLLINKLSEYLEIFSPKNLGELNNFKEIILKNINNLNLTDEVLEDLKQKIENFFARKAKELKLEEQRKIFQRIEEAKDFIKEMSKKGIIISTKVKVEVETDELEKIKESISETADLIKNFVKDYLLALDNQFLREKEFLRIQKELSKVGITIKFEDIFGKHLQNLLDLRDSLKKFKQGVDDFIKNTKERLQEKELKEYPEEIQESIKQLTGLKDTVDKFSEEIRSNTKLATEQPGLYFSLLRQLEDIGKSIENKITSIKGFKPFEVKPVKIPSPFGGPEERKEYFEKETASFTSSILNVLQSISNLVGSKIQQTEQQIFKEAVNTFKTSVDNFDKAVKNLTIKASNTFTQQVSNTIIKTQQTINPLLKQLYGI